MMRALKYGLQVGQKVYDENLKLAIAALSEAGQVHICCAFQVSLNSPGRYYYLE